MTHHVTYKPSSKHMTYQHVTVGIQHMTYQGIGHVHDHLIMRAFYARLVC